MNTLTDILYTRWPPLPSYINKHYSAQSLPKGSSVKLPMSAWFFSVSSWVAASSLAISTAAILRHAPSLSCGLRGNLKKKTPFFFH